MNAKHQLTIAVVLACLMPAAGFAQSLGINFASDDPDVASSTLNPTDLAGVVPAANWNNLVGANGSGVGGLVYNAGGTPVASGATVTWSSPYTYRSGGNNSFPAGPNKKLYSGYLDTTESASGRISITVNSIDVALRSSFYDVYVYYLGDWGDGRGGGYSINDGINSVLKYGSSFNNPTGFVEDPGVDPGLSQNGNYLRFRGLSGSSFTLTSNVELTTPNGYRAPINAIQIVGGASAAPGPGDVNEDGATNIADYTIIKSNFFKTAGMLRTTGDLNFDGRVDLYDFAIWRNSAPAAEVAALGVPEPVGAMLFAVGAAALAGFTRHGRRSQCAAR